MTTLASPSRRLLAALLLAACLSPMLAAAVSAQQQPPVLAVAASLRPVMEDLTELFRKQSGQPVRVAYGATGNFVRQIETGAPFELLLAADSASVDRLAARGLTIGPGATFARGRISIVVARGSAVGVDASLEGLRKALLSGAVTRLSIANPDVAPYGAAAVEALKRAGLWPSLQGRIVKGENAGQAVQFVATGAAQAGIVAHALVVSKELSGTLTASLVREDWHAPIEHKMGRLRGAGAVATRFFEFMQSAEAREVLQRHGFALPGDAS